MAIKAFIFDVDGVIVDTEELKLKAWSYAVGRDLTLEEYQAMVGHEWYGETGYADLLTEIAKENRTDLEGKNPQKIREIITGRYKEHYEKLRSQEIPLVERNVELLHRLIKNQFDENGIMQYELAIASSDPIDKILGNLRAAGVEDPEAVFGSIISGATDLEEGRSKPKPDIYTKTIDNLQRVSPELGIKAENCMVFEDTLAGATAARRALIGNVFALPHRLSEHLDFFGTSHTRIEKEVSIDDFLGI